MEKLTFIGLDFNRISAKDLLLNRTMYISYGLIALALIGIYDTYVLRYFTLTATAHTPGMDLNNPELREAMKLAVFGEVGKVSREVPWTLYIANYMYLVYVGSGIIFLVAVAELMKLNLIAKAAAGFMTLGLAMVLGGLFTIATGLDLLAMHWMFLTPNVTAGMWLMLPLYVIYIPFVAFEIYLILTNNRALARRLAFAIVIMSLGLDFIEFYIQAKLFAMNTARELWTEFPGLMFYFLISASISSLGIMALLAHLVHRGKEEYAGMMELIRKSILFFVSILALYEIFAYMVVDKEWAFIILFGEFRHLYFGGYILLTLVIPFLLVFKPGKPILTLIAGLCVIVGGFIGRYIFVYGGTANPLSDRFGTGFEKYSFYEQASTFNYIHPHLSEILIVIGSFGVCLLIYKLCDSLLFVSELRDHH